MVFKEKLFITFIWVFKHPRFSKHFLYASPLSVGFGLLQFQLYYRAVRFTQLVQWNILESRVPWIQFESIPLNSIYPYYPPGLIWSSSVPTPSQPLLTPYYHNPSICGTKHKHYLISKVSPLATFLGDPPFSAAFSSSDTFLWCKLIKLTTLSVLQVIFNFITLDGLGALHKIPAREGLCCHFLPLITPYPTGVIQPLEYPGHHILPRMDFLLSSKFEEDCTYSVLHPIVDKH